MNAHNSIEPAPLLHDIPEVARRLGICKASVYGLLKRGELASVQIGRRRKVTETQLRTFVDGLSDGR